MNKIIVYRDDKYFFNEINDCCHHFNSSARTIIVIEPYGSAISFIKRGVELGFNIIIFTANEDMRKLPDFLVDVVKMTIQVDTTNPAKLINLVAILRGFLVINAVIPGFEYFVPAAFYLSRYLNLPGVEMQHVMSLRRKDVMRKRLRAANIPIPAFAILDSINQLSNALVKIGYPAICKPVDSAGSVHVQRVTTYSQAESAAKQIIQGQDVLWGHKLANIMLLEEYIGGKEYSLEGVVQGASITHFSITEKFVSDQLEFVEIGHIVNPPMDLQLKQRIEKYVEKVIRALGMDYCPFHAEIRLNDNNEPILMEIAARLAGDKIGDLINLSRGVNYFDYVYAAYLNEDLPPQVMDNLHAGIRFFYRPEVNTYSRISGMDRAKQYPIEDINFYYQSFKPIPSFPKPLRRLGHVIAAHENYFTLSKMLADIDAHIIFHLDTAN